MRTKIKLYHGSNCDFSAVDLSKSKDRRDFGKGFYLTTLKHQAKEWAEALFVRYGGDGIYVYEFEFIPTDDLLIKEFDGITEEWLMMIKGNRIIGGTQHCFDVVRGAVANDRTNRTLALFVEGIYDIEEALRKLKPNKLNDQFSIHTERALACLSLVNKTHYAS